MKGALVDELPVERPVKLYLAINGKLAQRLGIELSPEISCQRVLGKYPAIRWRRTFGSFSASAL